MKKSATKASKNRLLDFLQLWGVALVLVTLTISGASWMVSRLQDPGVMPVRFVKVEGQVRNLNLRQLEQVVYSAVDGSFFSVTLAKIRKEVELLPWVDSVSIRRVWPDTLLVRVVEQQALARWGNDALVNVRGEIFAPTPLTEFSRLALLEGEAQDSVMISQEYQKIETLLGTVGLSLSRVKVDARRAWKLWTHNGLELNLGRKQVMPRLSRFIRLYPELAGEDRIRLRMVDLRYTNGFTASWEALPDLLTKGDDPAVKGNARRLAGI